mmetsp:Transcript_25625/g.74135  ORF Transcript_25625/g.74135 Transcript_25625/m.74135 type:complete len:362 (-) Transcript_25625:1519-2604(-)
MTSALRQWWTGGSRDLLIKSQDVLIRNLVRAPASRLESSGGILNSVEFAGNPSSEDTLVMAHGYGSGLGFFFRNIDALLSSNQYRRIVLFDWLGMCGSHRPGCHASPIRGWSELTTSFCNSRFTASEAVDFFIDPLHNLLEEHNVQNMTLVGHSLGGYLSAKYVLQYPSERIKKLVLASPVGFPNKPPDALPPSQLPTGLRVVDALWSSNITPQQLVRMMGSTRGKRNVKRALRGRIPHLNQSESDMLSDYLYQVTVADPSGEYAINSLLEPVASPDTMGVFAREPLHQRMQEEFDSSISLNIIFGSDDWMRRNNEESARDVVMSIQSSNAAAVAATHIIPNAGHHLYLDNSDSFVGHILS